MSSHVLNSQIGHAPDVKENQATPRRELLPGEALTTRLAGVKSASNPLLGAARPLLRALADMPQRTIKAVSIQA